MFILTIYTSLDKSQNRQKLSAHHTKSVIRISQENSNQCISNYLCCPQKMCSICGLNSLLLIQLILFTCFYWNVFDLHVFAVCILLKEARVISLKFCLYLPTDCFLSFLNRKAWWWLELMCTTTPAKSISLLWDLLQVWTGTKCFFFLPKSVSGLLFYS